MAAGRSLDRFFAPAVAGGFLLLAACRGASPPPGDVIGPAPAGAWMDATRALYEKGEFERALAAARGLAVGFPDAPRADEAALVRGLAALGLAEREGRLEHWEEARRAWEEGLRYHGSSPHATEMHLRLGCLQAARRRPEVDSVAALDCDRALVHFQAVLDRTDSLGWMKAEALLERAFCLRRMGREKEAAQTLDRLEREFGELGDPEGAPGFPEGTSYGEQARALRRSGTGGGSAPEPAAGKTPASPGASSGPSPITEPEGPDSRP